MEGKSRELSVSDYSKAGSKHEYLVSIGRP